ncbi:hypothetical protein C0Q70_06598 [Pomacea canaliculata]|uniref:Uncharacterized protein n=1 Tax=Pomacea canaliculata TaxID=400727 RepID=A0A2T7PCP6_POMCA|nr:hypothetical protein C0Q70_06598 [Pomacea canaliculata]
MRAHRHLRAAVNTSMVAGDGRGRLPPQDIPCHVDVTDRGHRSKLSVGSSANFVRAATVCVRQSVQSYPEYIGPRDSAVRHRTQTGRGEVLRDRDPSQPTAHSPQPTVHNPQPTAHNPQPTAHSPQPTARSPQSTTRSPQPTTRSPQLTAHSPQLTAHSPQPTVHNPHPQPTTRSPQLTAHSSQSTAHSPQPAAHSPQPAARSPQSTVHSPQPAAHSPQPAAHSSQPAAHSPQSTAQDKVLLESVEASLRVHTEQQRSRSSDKSGVTSNTEMKTSPVSLSWRGVTVSVYIDIYHVSISEVLIAIID